MEIKKSVNLSEYSTFKIGGTARFFCDVSSEAELKESLNFSEKENLKYFILGNGSNLLISDSGFDGLVIKINIKGIKVESENSDEATVSAGAGEDWDDFVKFVIDKNLFGAENLSGIPGTVGASAVQNIGAYGVEIQDVFHQLEAFDFETGEVVVMDKAACSFAYRDSVFKQHLRDRMVILNVTFALPKLWQAKNKENISY
jgi:UDP-N-acetylmuramate dehydrogenase